MSVCHGQAIQRVTGAHHLAPEFHPPRKVNPVPRRLADVRRAREEIGFVAEVGLEERSTFLRPARARVSPFSEGIEC